MTKDALIGLLKSNNICSTPEKVIVAHNGDYFCDVYKLHHYFIDNGVYDSPEQSFSDVIKSKCPENFFEVFEALTGIRYEEIE